MLYRIGLVSEIPTLPSDIPKQVRTEITQGLVVLDCEYGEDRDYLESGGCSILIQNQEDLTQLKEIVDYDNHPCEWATRIAKTGYASALFITNNDYSILVYMPIDICPEPILSELED
jgi:hypothetical protein